MPSLEKLHVLLNSESDLLFLLKEPLNLLGDLTGLMKLWDYLTEALIKCHSLLRTMQSMNLHWVLVESIQEEMLSCIFNERRVLYAQARLPFSADKGSPLHSNSIFEVFVLLRNHVGLPDLGIFLRLFSVWYLFPVVLRSRVELRLKNIMQ